MTSVATLIDPYRYVKLIVGSVFRTTQVTYPGIEIQCTALINYNITNR